MRTPAAARIPVLVTGVLLAAGCSTAAGHGGTSTSPLQLRLVTSSSAGECTAPPLAGDAPGVACDREDGTTTYELGRALGTVTPASVAREGQGVVVHLDEADAVTLRTVTTAALGRQVAVLLRGKVVSAPVVEEPISNGAMVLTFATPAVAADVAQELRGVQIPG